MPRLRVPADFGALIRSRRRAAGLDQAALARRIGVSRLWVNQIERGKPGANLGLVLRALEALDIALHASDPGERPRRPVVGLADIDAIVAAARRLDEP